MASKEKTKAEIAEKFAAIPAGLTSLAQAAMVLAAYLQKHDPQEPLRLDEASVETGLTRDHIEVLIAASALGAVEAARTGSQKASFND
ncbi:MAG: hypothetical protein IBX61_07480 [Thermoleophilia bacterium]|nr:hypothetical protein [Thermoleophilia bacterium]